MASALKKSTKLTGLKVDPNPRHRLTVIYNRILGLLTKIPEQSAYRKHTEELIRHRQMIVESNNDVKAIETKINCGQAEELISQAQKELRLCKNFLEWKPWEPLKNQAPKEQWKWPPSS